MLVIEDQRHFDSVTEQMQHHYSTVNGAEQRDALAKVISLARRSGEDGGEGPGRGGEETKKAG